MNRPGQVFLQLLLIAAMLTIYHLLFHGAQPPTTPESDPHGRVNSSGPTAGSKERDELERMVRTSAPLGDAQFDPAALGALVDRSKVALSEQERAAVLPLLHAHLRMLHENVVAALDALDRGAGPTERMRYRAQAAQLHGRFQAQLRKSLTGAQASALFAAAPAMLPPVPSSRGQR